MAHNHSVLRTVLEGIHLGSLGVWCGMTVGVGVCAAIAFPTMRDLDPTLPAFAALPDGHWSIAAGSVMNPVFHILDGASLALAGLALITLVLGAWTRSIRLGSPSGVLRTLALICALGAALYSTMLLRPEMDAHLDGYLTAGREGDIVTALANKDAFDALHPRASMLIGMTLAFGALAFVFGAINALHRPSGSSPSSIPPTHEPS
jgi:hypothetical protein